MKNFKLHTALYILIAISFIVVSFMINFCSRGMDQQHVYLARALLNGKFYFTDTLYSWYDTSLFNGRHYWPLGAFPAVTLMPFVYLFGKINIFFYQGYLNFFLIIGVILLIYKIAAKIGFKKNLRLFWAVTFCFGSVFIGVALWPSSWFFSQTLTVFLLFFLIYLNVNNAKPEYSGIICGLILLTRTSAFLSFLFPLIVIIFGNSNVKNKLLKLIRFFLPIILFLVIWLSYNYARFNSPLEQGYKYQIILNGERKNLGVFSYKHIPTNLYYLLIATPEPVFRKDMNQVVEFPFVKNNEWGMSILITSPYLFYLFTAKRKSAFRIPVLISGFSILIPILLYYGIGARQYGYRYSLDFLPFLFFLLMDETHLNKFSNIKNVMRFSIFVNTYLYLTLVYY